MDLTNRPRRSADYRLETVDDETLLYHPACDKILQFNQTASLIWQLCDGERTVAEIIGLLQESYPEAAAEIAEDVLAMLDQFVQNGCVSLG